MNKIKPILGYILAALCIPVALATFIGMGSFGRLLVGATGVVISPKITGGEVLHSLPHDSYQTHIYEPVFEGLLWETRTGFVQVVWTPLSALPETLDEEIDFNADGQADFRVNLQPATRQAQVEALSPAVLGLEGVYAIGDGLGVRVRLENQ